ncbi:MAG: hypothetical protein HOV83_24820, partial [Catenulispora sp.]|nr:hypothetical protein [Catenulispora sp.]
MSDLPAFVTSPEHVRAVDFGHVLVLIDYRTGQVKYLPPKPATQWTRAARTGITDGMDPALLRLLLDNGHLHSVPAATPWPAPDRPAAATR